MNLLYSVGVTIRIIGLIFYLVFKIFEFIVHTYKSPRSMVVTRVCGLAYTSTAYYIHTYRD